jgi:HD-GYP domain-containing protein (c-di-GMP phosphodiesterase class II)
VESPSVSKKSLQIGGTAMVGLVAALGDQAMRSEPLLSEWWLDVPLAALVAVLILRAAGRRHRRPSPASRNPAEALDEVVGVVSRGGHVDDVLETLTRQACHIMQVERAVVVVRDDADPRLAVVIAGHGVPRDYVGRRIGIDEGMAGRVIMTGEPVLVDDYGSFPRAIAHAAGEGLRAGAAVPIRREGIVRGALAAGTTQVGRRFGPEELESLLRFAELGAVALEQARMREELERAVEAGVEVMAAAVDMRDDYTGTHSDEVVRLARTVGERMGLSEEQLGELEFAARLHDVGKIGVPDAVLRKQGPLEGGEWEIMRQHPAWGADMLRRVPGLRRVSGIVRHAHERWDGDGYPDRLSEDDIPLASRIIFACDAYNAMTSDRPYRDALRPWIAVSELREGAGGQFDPDVVDALVGVLRDQQAIDLRLFRHAHRSEQPTALRR